jgi:hypothetical protein
MRFNSRAFLLAAAAALAAAPVHAQPGAAPATPSGGLVRIDPCTRRPYPESTSSAAQAGASTGAPGGAATSSAAAQGTATQSGGASAGAMGSGTAQPQAGASSSTSAQGAGPQAGDGSAGTTGNGTAQPQAGASSSTSAQGAGTQMGGASAGAAGSGTAQPQTGAYSSTSAQGTMPSAFSPTGTAVPDTGRIGDPATAARNREALRLGTGAVRGQVRLGPAASVSVPTAFGVDAGELFLGAAYQGRTRYTEEDDAAAVAGLGIGTRRIVALEIALTSYSTLRGAPLETGGLSFKLHRALPGNTSVAVGWENAILWGNSDDRGSVYAAGTRIVPLRADATRPFSVGVFTLGVGSGRFRFEDDDADDKETVNVFGAVGLRITDPLSVVADWTGQDLNLAASITPIRRVPLVVTAGVADLTGSAGDGARFILSLGYGLSIRQPF